MVIPRGNLIDGDWKLTKSVETAQKKNAKASKAWAGVTTSAKGRTSATPRPRPAGHQWNGQRTSSKGESTGGRSKYSSGDEARNAYVDSLRAQAAIRAAEEQRVVKERRRSDKPRPGLPMTGGGDKDDGGVEQQLRDLGKKDGGSLWTKLLSLGKSTDRTPTFQELRKQEWDANEELQKQQHAAELAKTKEVQEASKEAGIQNVTRGVPSKLVPTRAEVSASRQTGQVQGRFEEMTWEDYNALDPETRAAVDANTLLREAVDKDTALVTQFDSNKDGRLSYAEGRKHYAARDDKNYGNNYHRVFNRGVNVDNNRPRASEVGELNDLTYAPNTLAVLNMLDLNDKKGVIDDYLNGTAFVNADDIKEKRHVRKEGKTDYTYDAGGRDALNVAVTEGMQRVTQEFDTGNAFVNGEQQALSIENASAEKFGQLVESLRAEMSAGNSFDHLTTLSKYNETPPTRVDLSALEDVDYAERRGYLDTTFAAMQADPDDKNMIENREFMQPLLDEYGSNWEEWMRLVDNRKRYPQTRAYNSTVLYEDAAIEEATAEAQQIVAQGGAVSEDEFLEMVRGIQLVMRDADDEDEEKK